VEAFPGLRIPNGDSAPWKKVSTWLKEMRKENILSAGPIYYQKYISMVLLTVNEFFPLGYLV
jgi:hypothetical protein